MSLENALYFFVFCHLTIPNKSSKTKVQNKTQTLRKSVAFLRKA